MTDPRKHTKARILIVLGMALLFPIAIGVQMARVQLFEGTSLRSLWDAQALDIVPVRAQRGTILDAKGRILVSNTTTYSVAIDPLVPNTRPGTVDQILETLAAHTPRSAEEYRRRVRSAPQGSRYIVLERAVSYDAYNALKALGFRNTILEGQYRRRYNYNTLGAHLVGYVNHEINGMMGLEASYNSILKGRDGEQQVQRDRLGRIRAMVGAPRRQPIQGHSLKTTIDAHIQAIVEEELKQGVINSRAKYGSVIVVDPRTGAVKAMANYPTYNPNAPGVDEGENRRNFAISDMVEPGSTFKLVTAVAAIEQNAVKNGELFETPATGVRMIHGQAMRDHDPLGTMDFENVIKKSSNIATAEIAMRLPRETFYQYARNMGFGTHTGIDLTNEEAGRMQRPYNWSQVTLPWMSIGYEVQVTPLQMVMAYSAFANNGVLMRPYVVDEILDENGNIIKKHKPTVIRRAISQETVRNLMPIFEGVVTEDGTAEFARIEGIAIGGKTGTAQKYIDGRYQARYRASFIGFYPTNEPQYVVMVMIDEPRTSIYGGYISGPIFRRITSRIMGMDENLQKEIVDEVNTPQFVNVPNVRGLSKTNAEGLLASLGIRYQVEGSNGIVLEQSHESGQPLARGERLVLKVGTNAPVIDESSSRVLATVPDIRGLSMRQAILSLTEIGFDVQQVGSGTVYAQFPLAGAQYEVGREVTIRGRARSMNTLVTATSGAK
jgi:cell division protein FtsI/penicillin-binding protein 2